jgi:hypothetical protein
MKFVQNLKSASARKWICCSKKSAGSEQIHFCFYRRKRLFFKPENGNYGNLFVEPDAAIRAPAFDK